MERKRRWATFIVTMLLIVFSSSAAGRRSVRIPLSSEDASPMPSPSQSPSQSPSPASSPSPSPTTTPSPNPTPSPFPMPSERPTPWPGAVLEDPIAQLTDLLSPQGVSVTESKLIRVYDVRRYRSLVVEWTSYKDAPEIVDYESSSFEHINQLKVLSSTTRDGTLQPQRIASGFSDEIFVAGVNATSQLIWWTRMPDPRVLRSEGANSEGRLSGRLYHRSRVEIRIYAPEEPEITEVKLYLTKPSGNRFILMPLYSVPFTPSANNN